MGEVVNLRLARKAKKRAGKERKAEANRTKFGRSKAEKQADQLEKARAERMLDGARLGDD